MRINSYFNVKFINNIAIFIIGLIGYIGLLRFIKVLSLEDLRQLQLSQWLVKHFDIKHCSLTALNGDAGFRRYFRFIMNNQSYIAVDSPVDTCNNAAFINIQQKLKAVNVSVPKVVAHNDIEGFFCLSDLGEIELSSLLTLENMSSLYAEAIDLLPKISNMSTAQLPVYNADFIQLELNIFKEWLLKTHLNIELSSKEQQQLNNCFEFLITSAIEQPQVAMHRDFHSRNIMVIDNNFAVIDFQDAVVGPITYDIVSLLRDCYVKWPLEKIMPLFSLFVEKICQHEKKCSKIPLQQWLKWFDLMGLQRHLKASGIFARLHHRDNKSTYLHDIPLTLSYIIDVSTKYPELTYLHHLVKNIVLPKINKIQ